MTLFRNALVNVLIVLSLTLFDHPGTSCLGNWDVLNEISDREQNFDFVHESDISVPSLII